jgi:hypothetical protein
MRRAWLLVQATVLLVVFEVLTLSGLARLHRFVSRFPIAKRRPAPTAQDHVLWAVDEACIWFPKTVYCLQRSTVTALLLKRQGVAAQVVIGYRSFPMDSHAWVEVDGVVVNDRPQYKKFFHELERM